MKCKHAGLSLNAAPLLTDALFDVYLQKEGVYISKLNMILVQVKHTSNTAATSHTRHVTGPLTDLFFSALRS